jgi:hypothetical protein
MNRGRVALLVTCVMVAGLGTWLALSRSDDGNRVAIWAAALVTVAAIAAAVWLAWRTPRSKPAEDGDRSLR